MFAAWGCAWCSKLVPTKRRDADEAACSDRCDLGMRLQEQFERTGVRRAWCPVCKQVKDAEAFHREKNTRNGLSSRCKDCQRSGYEKNQIAYRRRRFRYGLPSRHGSFLSRRNSRTPLGRCGADGAGSAASPDATEEDHVKPLSAGGTHCLANLCPACKPRNASKRGVWPLDHARLAPTFRHPDPRPGRDLDVAAHSAAASSAAHLRALRNPPAHPRLLRARPAVLFQQVQERRQDQADDHQDLYRLRRRSHPSRPRSVEATEVLLKRVRLHHGQARQGRPREGQPGGRSSRPLVTERHH